MMILSFFIQFNFWKFFTSWSYNVSTSTYVHVFSAKLCCSCCLPSCRLPYAIRLHWGWKVFLKRENLKIHWKSLLISSTLVLQLCNNFLDSLLWKHFVAILCSPAVTNTESSFTCKWYIISISTCIRKWFY